MTSHRPLLAVLSFLDLAVATTSLGAAIRFWRLDLLRETTPDWRWIVPLAALGALHLFFAVALPMRASWARRGRRILAVPELFLFPVGTAISWIFWGALRPEGPDSSGLRTAMVAIPVVTASIVVATAIWAHLYGAVDRGKMTRTMADLRRIGAGIEAYREAHDGAVPDTQSRCVPLDDIAAPTRDAWGFRLGYCGDGTSYCLYSTGADGLPRREDFRCPVEPGRTADLDAEIVFSDGRFVRYPEGLQK